MSNRPVVPVERLCTAHVSDTDERCKVAAIKGGTVCVYHGGSAGPVREAANRRLAAMVDPALAALAEIVRSSESDQTKLAAAKDILDRVGLGATQKIAADVHVFDTREALMERAQQILETGSHGDT